MIARFKEWFKRVVLRRPKPRTMFDDAADAIRAFDAAISGVLKDFPARQKRRMDWPAQPDLPAAWFDFNRYCWRVYGTGRTEPDKAAR